MKKEIVDKWVAALRSGKYSQAKERLKTDDEKYCCLGVLCEVIGEDYGKFGLDECDDPVFKVNQELSDEGEYIRNYETELPMIILNSVELNSKSQTKLINMNDGNDEFLNKNLSFSEIADYIEANWEHL